MARSIQETVLRASEEPLQDDAIAVILAPVPSGENRDSRAREG